MSWKKKFTFHQKHDVEQEVCGQTFRFFPNRIGLLHELADVAKPIAGALSVFFADHSADIGTVMENMTDASGVTISKTTIQPMSPETMKARGDERQTAITTLLESISDPRNRLLLGRLLMDSLREQFDYKNDRSAAEVEEFLLGDGQDYMGLDLPALTGMLQGWIKANAKVFGAAAGEQVAAAVRERLSGLQTNSQSETPTQTDGSNSKTQSTPQSVAAST